MISQVTPAWNRRVCASDRDEYNDKLYYASQIIVFPRSTQSLLHYLDFNLLIYASPVRNRQHGGLVYGPDRFVRLLGHISLCMAILPFFLSKDLALRSNLGI